MFTEEPEGVDPRFLFAIYPVEKAQITGNWDVMGLQATASFDYTLDSVYVPGTATFDMFDLTVYRGGPLYKLGVMPLTAAGHAGFAIGVVQRGLDELLAVARSKHRMGDAAPLAQNERFVHEIGELESRFRAARCWLHDTFASAERTVIETGVVDPMEALLTRQATAYITQEGADILRRAYLLAGTDALRLRRPPAGLPRHPRRHPALLCRCRPHPRTGPSPPRRRPRQPPRCLIGYRAEPLRGPVRLTDNEQRVCSRPLLPIPGWHHLGNSGQRIGFR